MSRHPLDSLSTEEFNRTTAALRASGDLIDSRRFASITLDEPAKAAVLAWREGDPIVRRSLSVLWDRADNKAYEAIVDLGETGDRHGGLVRPRPRRDARTSRWTSGTTATSR